MSETYAKYDEEDNVCTGCGSMINTDKDWCSTCAPELYA